jgi:hypothetical protein
MGDVPAQFKGQARVFMERMHLVAGHTSDRHTRLIDLMNARLDRGAMIRTEHIAEIERDLRTMDTSNVLDLEIVRVKKKTLEVGLLSLSRGWGSDPHDSPHFQLPFYRVRPTGTLRDVTYCS